MVYVKKMNAALASLGGSWLFAKKIFRIFFRKSNMSDKIKLLS